MLKMTLCKNNQIVEKLCKNHEVEFFDNIQLYVVTNLQNNKTVGLGFFQIADYEIEIIKIIYDKTDQLLFDFIVKGILGYGEQSLALTANFKNVEDEKALIDFGFIKNGSCFVVKLYEAMNNCKSCGK